MGSVYTTNPILRLAMDGIQDMPSFRRLSRIISRPNHQLQQTTNDQPKRLDMGHLLALSAVLLGMDVGAETAGVRARYSEITKLVTTGTAKEVRLYAPDDPASNEWAIVGPKASSRRSLEGSDV